MVKEVDGAAADVSWHRRWMRVYEHHAAMFLTPQQWGLDGEIVLALPLQGLVVANVEALTAIQGVFTSYAVCRCAKVTHIAVSLLGTNRVFSSVLNAPLSPETSMAMVSSTQLT